MNLTFECPIHFQRRAAGRKALRTGPPRVPTPLPEGTVPRVSRLMALAIHFDRLLASGPVRSMAELARSMRVTRARITQIMNLNRLAPDIQEALLFLPRTVSGRAAITERELRAAAAEVDWGRQGQSTGPQISGSTCAGKLLNIVPNPAEKRLRSKTAPRSAAPGSRGRKEDPNPSLSPTDVFSWSG